MITLLSLERHLRSYGCDLARQGAKHAIWLNQETGKRPSVPRHRELPALRLAGGVGCVRLLRHDEARGALLLERLGRSLHELPLPLGRRHEILCSTASRVWRRAPDCGLPTGAVKDRWLIEFITATWEDLGRPCSRRAVDHALGCAARWLGARTGLDATAIWEWGVVERVSTGLLGTTIDLQPVGRQLLAVADRLAGEALGSP